MTHRTLTAVALIALGALSIGPIAQAADILDEPELKEIIELLGKSKPHLERACYGGRTELLNKLDALRAERPDLFEKYDYGPVRKQGAAFGHAGVNIYRKPEPGESYDQAISDGAVVDYTNYYSENTGRYRVRGWDDWRWNDVAGKGVRDEDIKVYIDYYWRKDPADPTKPHPDGPRYPDSPLSYVDPETPHPTEPPVHETVDIALVYSLDPNDKAGPAGVGPARYFSPSGPLGYTVFFENLPEATAPARDVVVTDPLDSTQLDLSTMALGPITFGGHTVTPLPGASTLETTLDLRPEQELLVRITAKLESGPDRLVWRLKSVDPATGMPPSDPLLGFLPPNMTPPEGQGSVTFMIAARAGLASGTVVDNTASIVFDTNPAIETRLWQNTLDTAPPESQVDAATAAPCSQAIDMSWSGSDADSGLRDIDVYLSRDRGPWKPWLERTHDTGATFYGSWGKTYGFATVAHDRVGHTEALPAFADVEATVDDCGPTDLAVTHILATKTVRLTPRSPEKTKRVWVLIQNRSPVTQTIATPQALDRLVDLRVVSLGDCEAPPPRLASRTELPRKLRPRQSLALPFLVPFECANDPRLSTRWSPGHEDYQLEASVDATAIGGTDSHPADDVCPRTVAPPGEPDPYPDGTLLDKGCGRTEPNGTHGAPVQMDVLAW